MTLLSKAYVSKQLHYWAMHVLKNWEVNDTMHKIFIPAFTFIKNFYLQIAGILTLPFDVIKTHRQIELGEVLKGKHVNGQFKSCFITNSLLQSIWWSMMISEPSCLRLTSCFLVFAKHNKLIILGAQILHVMFL